MFLAGALRVADQAAIGQLANEVRRVAEKTERADQKLADLKQQSDRDATALNLAYRQLNPIPNLPDVTQDELDAAITAASSPIRVQIFNQAWQVRSENWSDDSTKPKMERTIPLFKALIRSDTQNQYHLNHGQLGFALKDQRTPDWAEAEKELTRAIEMRGPWEDKGWLFYEYNRALCRINLDEGFKQDSASDPAQTSAILDDLKAAAHASDVKKIIRNERVIQDWLALNKLHKVL